MAITREFKETVAARIQQDRKFRIAMLSESIDCLLSGDLDIAKAHIRDFINATVGFTKLAQDLQQNVKSLQRMFGPNGNPQAKNLLQVIVYLQRAEGVRMEVRAAKAA